MSEEVGYETVYTCDVCKIATFPTLQAAEVHEAQCHGPPPSSGSVARDSSAVNGTKVFHAADASHAPFRGAHDAPPGAADKKTHQGNNAAVDNEVISIQSSSDESEGPHGASLSEEPVDKDALRVDNTAAADAPEEEAQNTKADDDVEYATVWICDICKVARFDTYEDAVTHENGCKGPPASDAHTKDQIKGDAKTNRNLLALPSTYPSSSTGHHDKKILLLSPVTDTYDPTKLSHHFFTILRSIDLLYHSFSGLISFHCHYCSTTLPTSDVSWNFKRVAEVLPNAVTKHLLGRGNQKRCAVPPTVLAKLNSKENAESSCLRAFEAFIHKVFRELNIEARKTDALYVYNKAAASGEDTKQTLGTSKKRHGSGKSREQSLPKRQKPIPYPVSLKVKQYGNMGASLQVNEQGNQFYLAPYAPLDGVPLVSSISSKESKKLPLPLQLLLQQVEFFNLSSLTLSPEEETRNSKAVGIRCQNCVSSLDGCGYIALSSVKDLPSDLLTISSDHLVYCRCTENSTKSILKDYSVADLGLLSEYCRIVTKIYGLKDLTNGDASVVVWGDCQAIPSGYCGSPNISIDFSLL